MEDQIKISNIGKLKQEPTFYEGLLKSKLFQESTFIIYHSFLPLKVTKKNLELACNTTNVMASLEVSTDMCHGISFSTLLEVQRGTSMVIYFYVTTVEDILLHLRHHLQDYRSALLDKKNANLEIICPISLSVEMLIQQISPYLGSNSKYAEGIHGTMMIVQQPLVNI